MAQYGSHVPEGIAATTIEGVVQAAAKMKDEKDEVCKSLSMRCRQSVHIVRPAVQPLLHSKISEIQNVGKGTSQVQLSCR
jgi:hypothetical protein